MLSWTWAQNFLPFPLFFPTDFVCLPGCNATTYNVDGVALKWWSCMLSGVALCTFALEGWQLNVQGSATLPELVLSPLNDCTGECGSVMLMRHAASSDTLQHARVGVKHWYEPLRVCARYRRCHLRRGSGKLRWWFMLIHVRMTWCTLWYPAHRRN